MNQEKITIESLSLDNVSFNEGIRILYTEPQELLQVIYNDLTDAGTPGFIAVPASKKAFNLTRGTVTEALRQILDNPTSVDEWGV